MALVDADYHFIYIDVGNYGSNGDSGIFKNSTFGEAFAGQLLNVQSPKRLPGYPDRGDPTPMVKRKTGFPLINPYLTTASVGPVGL